MNLSSFRQNRWLRRLVWLLVGVLVLWAVIGDGFDAVLHILPAISTGGFSPCDDSLAGMAHRVQMLAGRLDIDSAPGKGTRITARVPFARLH